MKLSTLSPKINPEVSVVMSVFNSESYLQEAIDSVLMQTFGSFEFLIVDDASTDNSLGIIQDSAAKDSRIKLIQNPENIGLTKSLNKAIGRSQGKYIARQDADDVSLPIRFEKQVHFLRDREEVVLVSCNIELINSAGESITEQKRACEPEMMAWYLLFYNRIAGHSQVMYRREPVAAIGGYCESYRYCQDYELWCRLVGVGDIATIPEVLLKQRRHEGSISAEKSLEQRRYAIDTARQNFKRLTHADITFEQAEDLERFWLGHWNTAAFPSGSRVGDIHFHLSKAYKAFVGENQTYCNQNNLNAEDYYQLIAQHFLEWIKALSVRRSLKDKILVSFYALQWTPVGVFLCWHDDISSKATSWLKRQV